VVWLKLKEEKKAIDETLPNVENRKPHTDSLGISGIAYTTAPCIVVNEAQDFLALYLGARALDTLPKTPRKQNQTAEDFGVKCTSPTLKRRCFGAHISASK